MEDNNATTIAVYRYWDLMDGDAMVCSPRGPSDYQAMCNLNQYVLGVTFTFQGLWLLFNARRFEQLVKTIGSVKNNPHPTHQKVSEQQRVGDKAKLLYLKRLTYVFASEFFCNGVAHLIGGNGTIYPTSTGAGLVADFLTATAMAWNLYHSLIQLRGAEAFRNLVQLPTHSSGTNRKQMWIKYALDVLQSFGAFPITFGFWMLLSAGVITRPHFWGALTILMGGAGIRAFVENILDRVRTLARVHELQQGAGGDFTAKRRRRDTLKKLARTLVLDTAMTLVTNVFLPASVLILKSVNSTTQILIHQGTSDIIMSVLAWIGCFRTHNHVNWRYSRVLRTTEARTTPTGSTSGGLKHAYREKAVYTVADDSGLSVVEQSVVAAQEPRAGLFSGMDSHF